MPSIRWRLSISWGIRQGKREGPQPTTIITCFFIFVYIMTRSSRTHIHRLHNSELGGSSNPLSPDNSGHQDEIADHRSQIEFLPPSKKSHHGYDLCRCTSILMMCLDVPIKPSLTGLHVRYLKTTLRRFRYLFPLLEDKARNTNIN
jgi:hypothetical protein